MEIHCRFKGWEGFISNRCACHVFSRERVIPTWRIFDLAGRRQPPYHQQLGESHCTAHRERGWGWMQVRRKRCGDGTVVRPYRWRLACPSCWRLHRHPTADITPQPVRKTPLGALIFGAHRSSFISIQTEKSLHLHFEEKSSQLTALKRTVLFLAKSNIYVNSGCALFSN